MSWFLDGENALSPGVSHTGSAPGKQLSAEITNLMFYLESIGFDVIYRLRSRWVFLYTSLCLPVGAWGKPQLLFYPYLLFYIPFCIIDGDLTAAWQDFCPFYYYIFLFYCYGHKMTSAIEVILKAAKDNEKERKRSLWAFSPLFAKIPPFQPFREKSLNV